MYILVWSNRTFRIEHFLLDQCHIDTCMIHLVIRSIFLLIFKWTEAMKSPFCTRCSLVTQCSTSTAAAPHLLCSHVLVAQMERTCCVKHVAWGTQSFFFSVEFYFCHCFQLENYTTKHNNSVIFSNVCLFYTANEMYFSL